MIEVPDKLTNDAISAWVKDIKVDIAEKEERNDHRLPMIQVDVIPLACVWSLANQRLEGRFHSCFQFARDFMAHDEAPAVWEARAEAAGDMTVLFGKPQSYERKIAGLELMGPYSPYRFEMFALRDGRPEGQTEISAVEISLMSALGHAAYNSADGWAKLKIDPLGPPVGDEIAFFSQAGDHVRQFVTDKL